MYKGLSTSAAVREAYINGSSKIIASGDFDMSVVFRDADLTLVGGGVANTFQFGFSGADGAFLVGLSDRSGLIYFTYATSPEYHAGPGTTDTAGILRITRVGSTASGYYWDGSQFQLVHSWPNMGTADVTPYVGLLNDGTDDAIEVTFDDFSIEADGLIVPEPATIILLALGLLGLLAWGRRRKR